MNFYVKLVMLVIVAIQLAWFIYPRAGSSMADPYRNHERIAAFKQNAEAPSSASQFAVDREMRLLYEHLAKRNVIFLAANLVADTILILLFWNFGRLQRGQSAVECQKIARPEKC
jgi:hypothetical protein